MGDPDSFHRAFGDAVRIARDHAGMTQLELADAVGLTRTSITNLEAGRQRPLLIQAYAISQALAAPLDALLSACLEAARRDEIAKLEARLAALKSSKPETAHQGGRKDG